MKKPTVPLPDIEDDAAFAARLQPLASKVLPVIPVIRPSGYPDNLTSIMPEVASSETVRQKAASRRDEIESKRGPKKRYEYVMPVRVGDALAESARNDGVSATVRLLQVLRNAGYPVIPEDLLDLRLERGSR